MEIKKKITLIAYLVALLGIINETAGFFPVMHFMNYTAVNVFKNFTSALQLNFYNFEFLFYRNNNSTLVVNYLNLAFYAVLLIGTYTYQKSDERESRLLRFAVSLILLSNLVGLISSFATPLYYSQYIQSKASFWSLWFVGRLLNVGWVILTYRLQQYFLATRTRELIYGDTEEEKLSVQNIASRWQRFFHLIFDLFVSMLIFFPLIQLFGPSMLEWMSAHLGERNTILCLVLFIRLIYYPLCETIWGATPAKFLTETFVADEDGKKAGIDKIMLRTFARFIPFESLSFFGSSGWHDSLTQTMVFREKRTGVKGRWYLLIFPIFLGIVLLAIWGHSFYEDYQNQQYRKKQFLNQKQQIETGLDHLSTSSVIHLKIAEGQYSEVENYLKVEAINHDEITVTIIPQTNTYSKSIYQLEKLYLKNKNNLLQLSIKLSELKKAFCQDFETWEKYDHPGVKLLLDDHSYEIQEIVPFFRPVLADRGTGGYGAGLYLELIDYGWPASIVEITNLEGDLQWTNSLPYRIESVTSGDYPYFQLSASPYTQNSHYKVRMVIQDSLANRYNYILEGTNTERTLTEEMKPKK